MTTRWTYRVDIVDRIDAAGLNVLGADGWELISVRTHEEGGIELIFKRPAPDFRTRVTLDQRAEVTGGSGRPTGPTGPTGATT